MYFNNICFSFSFIYGILFVLYNIKLPIIILKKPNLNDIYRDDNNTLYKYKLKYISN